MKWYKKQMASLLSGDNDKQKIALSAKTATASNPFAVKKTGPKKIQKPGEKRSRDKTDSIS